MSENLKEKLTPRNPLGIIALFVSFIEAVATVSLKFVADAKITSLLWALVSFIILYPTLIAICFFVILWKKREILFGPMDFADPKGFENILLQKVERIEAKQDAARIDVDTALSDVLKVVDRLIEYDAVYTAVNIGREFLNKNEFDKSLQIFQHILKKVPPTHEMHYKVLANIAYSLMGKQKFDEAIELLRKVQSIDKGKNFRVWHMLALAYAYFKTDRKAEYKKVLNQAKKDYEYEELDMEFFYELYPEIADDLRPT